MRCRSEATRHSSAHDDRRFVMGIRLEGGYETNDFWREVRSVGDQILKGYGYDEWTVTLRPKRALNVERGNDDLDDDDAAISIDPTTRQLTIFGFSESDFDSPEEVVDRHIVGLISDAMGEAYDEDDEGGEG